MTNPEVLILSEEDYKKMNYLNYVTLQELKEDIKFILSKIVEEEKTDGTLQ